MDSPRQFTVEKLDAGQRLDKFLTTQLTDITRSQVQKLIRTGAVSVNGQAAVVHHFLKTGDVVTVAERKPSPTASVALGRSPAPEPTIIYEDDEMLVIDKPAGLLVHSTPHQASSTLADWLGNRSPAIRNVGPDPKRPGIVHRLDRDVSGLMVVAKTQASYTHLVTQFAERQVQKTYTAIVYGQPAHASGTITLPIGRSADGSYVARPRTAARPGDRPAETRYRVVKPGETYSWLEIDIATGRPHQIRAHLSAIGHPIVGDREYGPAKPFHHTGKRRIKMVAADRIMLHVTALRFTGRDSRLHLFRSPLPAAFERYR